MEAKREEEPRVMTLRPVEATQESFAPFGQVIAASPDGDQFGPHDAQLDLSRGIPRFYIMRLESRPLKFSSITHHASVTQCLGSIGGQDWYLGVAKPSIVDGQSGQDRGRSLVQSRAGHFYLPPDPSEVCVFRVSGPKFLKLHAGTWHAGPLFKADAVDFYNLELSNTNYYKFITAFSLSGKQLFHLASSKSEFVREFMTRSIPILSSTVLLIVDHTTHYFKKHDGVTFVIDD
ncbi:unnamed protein product [Triticum turgidum subsp. durum]|uniref:Ureidoglycolate hydrolase n=1 Tax=Triticum turgidum subsp. durum TaxID=4567 RepID=A0A9R1S5N8_TRITD|nr:unnamed protein product [Triticum turgidum subsp. durum]